MNPIRHIPLDDSHKAGRKTSNGVKVITSQDGEIFDVELSEDLLKKNRDIAQQNQQLLKQANVLAIDILGSIGSGKTSLVRHIVEQLKGRQRVGVIAGDLTTTIDAERIQEKGAEIIQINTGKECHLDANQVKKSLEALDLNKLDVLIIENVGNLICPGEFPLGAHKRMVVTSVTEGPYMIVKHPYIFQEAAIGLINKIDLAEAMEVNLEALEADAARVNPRLKVIRTNCRTGAGVDKVIEALGL